MQVGVADVGHFHRAGSGFENDIATQSLGANCPIGGSQAYEGGGRDQHRVVNQVGSRAAGNRAKLNTVAVLLVHQADGVRM